MRQEGKQSIEGVYLASDHCGQLGVNSAGALGFMQNTPPTPLSYLSLGKELDINPPVPAVIVWGLFLTDIRYLARHKHRLSGLRPPGKVSRKSGGETPRLRSEGIEARTVSIHLIHRLTAPPPSLRLPLSHSLHSTAASCRQISHVFCLWLYSPGSPWYLAHLANQNCVLRGVDSQACRWFRGPINSDLSVPAGKRKDPGGNATGRNLVHLSLLKALARDSKGQSCPRQILQIGQ